MISTTSHWIGGLSALIASSPAVAAAAEIFILSQQPTDWTHHVVPGALLGVIAVSLGAMGYLVTCEVAKRLSTSPLQDR